ncbi:MAG: GAF domain-containing protein [Thermodesulfovibrionales bacterium]|nr:GAF domain-containing protein [Thermodesulfovibrionales bacterium]
MLHNTDIAILSTTDRKEPLKIFLTNLKRLIDADYISIAVFDHENDRFKIEMSSFLNCLNEGGETIHFASTILKSAISLKASQYYPEINEDDLFPEDIDFKEKGLKSLLIVPLIAKGLPLGTLNLGNTKEKRFSKEEIEVAERYVLQVAIAIDNSNLWEEMQNMFMDTV